MNHWQMIAIAYGLTFVAITLETILLLRRRRAALQQAQAWSDADAPGGIAAGADSRSAS